MRIISAKILVTATALVAISAAQASDLEYEPELIKKYASFEKCVVALRLKQAESKADEGSRVETNYEAKTTTRTTVSDVQLPSKSMASFSVNVVGETYYKDGGGGMVGVGTDWYCKGRVMFKGGGHSAWVPIPAPPPLPTAPATPAAQ